MVHLHNTLLDEDVVWCASRETAAGFVSFLRRLIFASDAAFSKTSTTGVSPAAYFEVSCSQTQKPKEEKLERQSLLYQFHR
jgi:hypothetical protein